MASNATTTIAPDIIYDDGLSGGSVFCLLFFSGLALYFGGGMAIRKFVRGAEGQEMIPHYDFWVDLPNLIKVKRNKNWTYNRDIYLINDFHFFALGWAHVCLKWMPA